MIIFGQFTDEITKLFLLSLLSFCIAMLLTPIYTYFAYQHKLWKRRRTTSATGEALTVINKLSTRKRTVPTMAGLIMVGAVTIVTVLFNLDRQQTWLPLAGLLGGGIVGFIDDLINVRASLKCPQRVQNHRTSRQPRQQFVESHAGPAPCGNDDSGSHDDAGG